MARVLRQMAIHFSCNAAGVLQETRVSYRIGDNSDSNYSERSQFPINPTDPVFLTKLADLIELTRTQIVVLEVLEDSSSSSSSSP